VLASALSQLIGDRLRAVPLATPLIPPEVIARQIAEMQLALIDAWIAGRPAMQEAAAVAALSAGTSALVQTLLKR
jgi:molybdopterin-guanine dinucleotide biosynthesis protein A